jgi:hypothetical protein
MIRAICTLGLIGLLTLSAGAAVDLSFEASDTNPLQYPAYSGSTHAIQLGTPTETETSTTEDANDTLNPSDGTAGTACYKTTFQFDTDVVGTGEDTNTDPFVRITDFSSAAGESRHLLSDPSTSGGIGLYIKYDGNAGDLEIAVSIREEPVSSGDNEVYETTTWKTLSGASGWQYFHWAFASELATGTDAWGQLIGLGDAVYDGGGGGTDAPEFEAVHFRPITGTTLPLTDITVYIDDIHTGTPHSPLVPAGPPLYLDLATRSAQLIVSQVDIETFTAHDASLRGMGMLPTGELVFWDYDGQTAADADGILSVDPLNATPPSTLAVLVPGSAIDPALNAAGTLVSMNGIVADSAGTIYCSDFNGGGEDIIRITDPGGGSQAVTNILTADGHVGITLNQAEDQVVIAQEVFYGATSDDIVTLPVTGGTTSALLTQADITTLTAATDNDFSLPGYDPSTGDILVYNNVSRFGAGPVGDEDALLRITEPGGTANTVVEATLADLPANDGIDCVVADSYGNIYLFEDDFEGTSASKIIILLAQGGTATIDYSELEAVTGGTTFEAEQVQVYEANDEVTLYISDDDTSSIVGLTIGTTQATSVQSWETYR